MPRRRAPETEIAPIAGRMFCGLCDEEIERAVVDARGKVKERAELFEMVFELDAAGQIVNVPVHVECKGEVALDELRGELDTLDEGIAALLAALENE